jgi:hypothetical protein
MLPAPELAELLNECGGPGGGFVAKLLLDPVPFDGWLIQLHADVMTCAAFFQGKPALMGAQPYDDEGRGQTLSQLVNDEGPSHFRYIGQGGAIAEVYGRTGRDVAQALLLVARVEDGNLQGDALAEVLLGYVHGAGPAQVAEAIRALRKLPGGRAKPLLRLLRNRPDLVGLNLAVRAELDGTAGAGV